MNYTQASEIADMINKIDKYNSFIEKTKKFFVLKNQHQINEDIPSGRITLLHTERGIDLDDSDLELLISFYETKIKELENSIDRLKLL